MDTFPDAAWRVSSSPPKNRAVALLRYYFFFELKGLEKEEHIDENGVEFWYARELQVVLYYKEWRKFENVINKAKESCKNSDISVFEHFVGADKIFK